MINWNPHLTLLNFNPNLTLRHRKMAILSDKEVFLIESTNSEVDADPSDTSGECKLLVDGRTVVWSTYIRDGDVTAPIHRCPGFFVLHASLACCCTCLGGRGLGRGLAATDARPPVYHHTGTDGGQHLPDLIISASAAVHSCVPETSGLRQPDVFFVRQNVKHFDVFMTASVRQSPLPAADRPYVQRRRAVYSRITSTSQANSFRFYIMTVVVDSPGSCSRKMLQNYCSRYTPSWFAFDVGAIMQWTWFTYLLTNYHNYHCLSLNITFTVHHT